VFEINFFSTILDLCYYELIIQLTLKLDKIISLEMFVEVEEKIAALASFVSIGVV
jgi:hypothetical protein